MSGQDYTPLDNWRGPLPTTRKMKIAARNTWLKLRNRQTCCGNLGEPGC